jgi:hypothetical protein
MTPYYILDDSHQIKQASLDEWGEWFTREHDKRRVAIDEVGDFKISTVFLGLDYGGFMEGSKPLLFESMIFRKQTGYKDIFCERYSTWDEAKQGHAIILNTLADLVQKEIFIRTLEATDKET